MSPTSNIAGFHGDDKLIEGRSPPANGFRIRCASALTHPATVVALAVLLLNDLAFKAMWPGSWATGKLSDLAWMVFAPPLLAYLLSFPLSGHRLGWRVAFAVSYLGLPLLYAVYNSSETVHDLILEGLSMASGGTAGSPLDATDSVVIPMAMAIAIWVWRSEQRNSGTLRLRCGLLMAGIAALASVATSYPEPDRGITDLGVSDEGTIYASGRISSAYLSEDGGLSWSKSTRSIMSTWSVSRGVTSMETPRGNYEIRPSGIVVVDADDSERLVYSTTFMREGDGGTWVLEHATTNLEARTITAVPLSLVYDESSGNLVAAMGIQGVVVGTPDGDWIPRPVGRHSPVDFSFSSKTSLLLSDGVFWAMATALSLAACGLALVSSQYQWRELLELLKLACIFLAALVLLVGVPALLVVTGPLDGLFDLFGGAIGPRVLFIALIFGVPVVFLFPGVSGFRKGAGVVLGVLALAAAGGLAFAFGGSNADPTIVYPAVEVALSVGAFILGLTVLAVMGEVRHWRLFIPAFLAMNTLVVLVFMLWLHQGIALTLAKASAIVLVCLAGFILYGYASRENRKSVQAGGDAGEQQGEA